MGPIFQTNVSVKNVNSNSHKQDCWGKWQIELEEENIRDFLDNYLAQIWRGGKSCGITKTANRRSASEKSGRTKIRGLVRFWHLYWGTDPAAFIQPRVNKSLPGGKMSQIPTHPRPSPAVIPFCQRWRKEGEKEGVISSWYFLSSHRAAGNLRLASTLPPSHPPPPTPSLWKYRRAREKSGRTRWERFGGSRQRKYKYDGCICRKTHRYE